MLGSLMYNKVSDINARAYLSIYLKLALYPRCPFSFLKCDGFDAALIVGLSRI